jgi:7-cyano-7-deazaguanine synthase
MIQGENILKKCIAIMSGGPDSIGYAVLWKKRGYEVYPIIFKYGQKGTKEVEVAVKLATRLGFKEPKILDISFMKEIWRGTQLTDDSVAVKEEYHPTVVVPIRNAIFLTIAVAYAYMIKARVVIYGAHTYDIMPKQDTYEPIYPDCSPEFQLALQTALNLGHFRSERGIEIWSPAREGLTKTELLKKSIEIMGDLIYETWSCYLSGDKHCGKCESCRNRKRAFKEAGIKDRTSYEVDV